MHLKCILFVCLGATSSDVQCFLLALHSENWCSLMVSGNTIGCQGLSLDWLHAKQTSFLLYFHSGPLVYFLIWSLQPLIKLLFLLIRRREFRMVQISLSHGWGWQKRPELHLCMAITKLICGGQCRGTCCALVQGTLGTWPLPREVDLFLPHAEE